MSPFTTNNHSRVPPGFRFHPTDEELVGYYLQKKVAAKKIDLDVIREIDLYKMEPWDLQDRCRIGSAEQNEWYFFSHKDKKYPTGTRTNRATAAGFWKATGRDKAIRTMYKVIGMRKTLVFYKGRAPNGQKTDWIMHEYRLEDDQNSNNGCEDGWVVCRVFKKRNCHKGGQTHASAAYDEEVGMMSEMNGVRKKLSEDENSYMQSLLCKQEAMSISKTLASSAQQNNFYSMCDPFSALPQLESPKMEVGNSLRNSYPSPFSLNTTEFEVPDAKSGVTEDRQGGSDPVTDWRMVDRIAAAQLSQEDKASKEMRSYLTSDTDTLEDVGVFLGLSKHQNHGDYSSNCDADLWNFGR